MKFRVKTIRKQILYPFLIILITLPVVIIIFFNIGIIFTMQSSAKKELSSTVKTMESLLNSLETKESKETDNTVKENSKKNFKGSSERNSSEEADMARELSVGLTAAQLSGNTRFYILQNREILYPLNIEGDNIAAYFLGVMAEAEENITRDEAIHKCRIDGQSCFYKCRLLTHFDIYTDLSILFVTTSEYYTKWVISINVILIIILIPVISISSILALRIADSISRPIIDACTYAAEIGNGDFITVPVVESNEEIKQFCFSLNAMSTRLKDYDETQKQFMQNASHELRTPLMSIQGYAEGIENDVFPDPKEAAQVIKKESLRLNKLVTELLTLSRIENHTYTHNLRVCNISDLLLDYIQRVNGLFMKEKLSLKTELSEHVSALLDEGLFSQTIINIISNASRYAKKEIFIKTYLETVNGKKFSFVEIADDGEGIAQEELPHLFERFYKGSKGNFGLGLAISKSAMESMGGSLKAFNRQGAVFLLQLPYAEE